MEISQGLHGLFVGDTPVVVTRTVPVCAARATTTERGTDHAP